MMAWIGSRSIRCITSTCRIYFLYNWYFFFIFSFYQQKIIYCLLCIDFIRCSYCSVVLVVYVCFCVFVLPILNLPETSWEAAWHSLGSFCYYTSGGNDILRLKLSIDFVNQRRGNACPYKLWRLLIKKIPCAAFILTVVFFFCSDSAIFPFAIVWDKTIKMTLPEHGGDKFHWRQPPSNIIYFGEFSC